MLARREHSCHELEQKLLHKGCSAPLVHTVIADLKAQRLVSDERYTETWVRARRGRGYGPVRIRQELQEKGVEAELIATHLDFSDPVWRDEARDARAKRFGARLPAAAPERAKQMRFLQSRGFTFDQVRAALNLSDEG
jgi:regulatory protein